MPSIGSSSALWTVSPKGTAECIRDTVLLEGIQHSGPATSILVVRFTSIGIKFDLVSSMCFLRLSEYGNCATVPTGLDFYIGGSYLAIDGDSDSDSDSDVVEDEDKIEYKSRTGAQIDIPRGDRELEIVRLIRKSHYDDDTRTLWLVVQSRTDSSKALLVSAYLGKFKRRQGFKIHAHFDAEDIGCESTLTEKFVFTGGQER